MQSLSHSLTMCLLNPSANTSILSFLQAEGQKLVKRESEYVIQLDTCLAFFLQQQLLCHRNTGSENSEGIRQLIYEKREIQITANIVVVVPFQV